ncbi:MAG: DUF4387 domain-containing protein [Armatimonadetes bacterium]|nr:DUF4387 domain-containing protein [Armatimonadota bacterium]
MTTVRLGELAEILRSKNCSPYALTLDVFFKTDAVYQLAKERDIVNRALVQHVYGMSDDQILGIVYFDAVRAVKVTIARPVSSGAVGDTDVYGAQQHVPLLDAEVPWEDPPGS